MALINLIKKVLYCFFLVFLLGSLGCSVKKNTASSRAFHNLVSHYNIYFNAKESYKSGIRKASKQLQPDFTKTMPVFPLETKETAGLITSEMDRVVKKASKLITYHSITAKPKQKKTRLTKKEKDFFNLPEYNKWVDDSYLLMGKAQYMKNDLPSALISFNYIINKKYPDPEVVLEARLWAAKVYDRTKDFRAAEETLQGLEKEKNKIPSSLLEDYYKVRANHYLLHGETDLAIEELKKAFEYIKKKDKKAFTAYLLGQLYEEKKDMADAVKYYRMVFHLNPPYEMAFNAHIRIAEDTETYAGNLKQIKKDLRKLLRDEKNKEYRDQIYYAFGKIAMKENKPDEAIAYFIKSAHYSVSNDVQKGLSYLAVAEIYFDRNDYDHAQMFYDSTVAFLPGNYAGYENYKNESNSLNRLVRYTREITLQDSLQHLAALPEKKRLAIIDGIIEQLVLQEKQEAEQNASQAYSRGQAMQTDIRYQSELNRSGQWYFYNPTALGFGRTEFKRRWGNRKLEDNWRRKNKASVSFESATQEEDSLSTEQVIKSVQKTNKKSRSYYLRQIPLNDSMMVASNAQLQEGLFESAMIFYNDLKDYDKAIHNLERLATDFPQSIYLLATYYTLYSLYRETGKTNLADKYKNLIIEKFPDSEQAKVLKDPLYLKKINEQRLEEDRKYEQVYHLFKTGHYQEVIRRCDQALQKRTGADLKSKYMFLRAVSIGKTSDPRTFKKVLMQVADSVTDQDIADRAKNMISYLNQEHPVLKQEEIEKTASVMYHFNPKEDHLLTIFVNDPSINLNQLKFEIINFNTDQYPQTDFEVKTDKDAVKGMSVISVKTLGKYKEAMDYMKAFDQYPALTPYVHNPGIEVFIFSESGFKTFLKNKSLDTYRVFYKKYYLR